MNQNVQAWLNSHSAKQYLQLELASVKKITNNLCGQVAVQLTLSENADYLAELNVVEKFSTTSVFSGNLDVDGFASLEELPFSSNEFGVVLVPCLSLFSHDIHSALREVYRVTAPEGLVLLTGINAVSLMGLQAKIYPQRYPFLPTVGLNQMKSWLSLLGYEIVAGDLFQYGYLSDKSSLSKNGSSQKIEKIGNRWLPMFSGGYSLLAKKRVFSGRLNHIKTAKSIKSGKIAGSLANKA